MIGQVNMFDFLREEKGVQNFKPGDWIEKEFVGEKMTFDEITEMVGNLVVMDMSTQSHNWYKVVMVEKIHIYDNGERRLIYYDGHSQRGLVNEMYFDESIRYPARAYRLKGASE